MRLCKCRSLPSKLPRSSKRVFRDTRIRSRKLARSTGNLELCRNYVSRRASSRHVIDIILTSLTNACQMRDPICRKPRRDLQLDRAVSQISERGLVGLSSVLRSSVHAMLRVEHLGPDRGFRFVGLPRLEPVFDSPALKLGMHQLSYMLRAMLLASLQ